MFVLGRNCSPTLTMPHVNAFDDALTWFDALCHQARIEFEHKFSEIASQTDTLNVSMYGDTVASPDTPDISMSSIPSQLAVCMTLVVYWTSPFSRYIA